MHALCSLIESVTREFDSFTDVDQWVPKLHDIYKEIGGFSSKDVEARVTSSFLYALAFRQPESPTFESWRQKALDILEGDEKIDPSAALDSLRKAMAEHTLHDALWPDADGDAAVNAFSTTLHRLRKMLQYEKAVRVSDGKVSLDERYCWVDVQLFRKYLIQK